MLPSTDRTSLMTKPIHAANQRRVAIATDGNGCWATRKFLPRSVGNKQNVGVSTRGIKTRVERNSNVLKMFAFSAENWSRPTEEVPGLWSR